LRFLFLTRVFAAVFLLLLLIGELHPDSKEFEMTEMTSDTYPEFLPRFMQAYRSAHVGINIFKIIALLSLCLLLLFLIYNYFILYCVGFRESLKDGKEFQVTQREILDAQVQI
jgi:hypothetical protein